MDSRLRGNDDKDMDSHLRGMTVDVDSCASGGNGREELNG